MLQKSTTNYKKNVSAIALYNKNLPEYENLRAAQSNWSVMCDGSLEVIALLRSAKLRVRGRCGNISGTLSNLD